MKTKACEVCLRLPDCLIDGACPDCFEKEFKEKEMFTTVETEPICKPYTVLIRSLTANKGAIAFEYLEFETEELAKAALKQITLSFPDTHAVVLQTELLSDPD